MQNRPNSVAFENKQKTWAGSSQAQQQLRHQPSRQQLPPRQLNNPYAKPILNKCLKCREPRHRSNEYRPKNLNLVKTKVSKVEVNDVEDGDDEEALGLEANEGELLNCIVQKILLTSKFEEDKQYNKIFRTCAM